MRGCRFVEADSLGSCCTILVVNWNSWDLLVRCLDALSQQTFTDFKVLVADNASSQPPPDELLLLHPEVELVRNEENFGFAGANNRLLERAKNSKWIVLLNPDAFPEPDWLEQLFEAASSYPEYQFFSSRLLQADNPAILDGEGDNYHISGIAWRKGFGKYTGKNLVPSEIFSPCAAAAMYRTNILIESGAFDEDFFCYFEDVDLGFRLRLAGHRCLLVPASVVLHVGSATTGGQRSDFSVYHGHRNLVWTYIKNMPGMLFWLLLPLHILLNLVTIGWFSLQGQGMVIYRAKRDAVKALPKMWRKRQVIQAGRVASIGEIWRVLDKRLFGRRV